MLRALITGIQGFTGRYMAAELGRAGYEVFGTGRHPGKGSNYFQADLEDADQVRRLIKAVRPEVVVHLAGVAYVGHDDPGAFYRVNLIGTRNLLQAISYVKTGIRAILISSSANVYGNARVSPIPETTFPKPANDYAVSKLAMEYMANLWMDRLPIFIARPFNYTGVGQDTRFVIPKIVSHFREKKSYIELGNLDVYREYNDVRSVVCAYHRLIEACPVGETVNVCSGRAYCLREVLDLAEKISGHRLEVKVNPVFVRTNEVHRLTGDKNKLESIISQWDSQPLSETLQWMLSA